MDGENRYKDTASAQHQIIVAKAQTCFKMVEISTKTRHTVNSEIDTDLVW